MTFSNKGPEESADGDHDHHLRYHRHNHLHYHWHWSSGRVQWNCIVSKVPRPKPQPDAQPATVMEGCTAKHNHRGQGGTHTTGDIGVDTRVEGGPGGGSAAHDLL